MRYTMIAIALLLLLAGSAAAQQAAPQPRLSQAAVGQTTADQAVATFGKPTYEHRCADGTLTLGWKRRAAPVHLAVQPARIETLVGKFGRDGRLVWVREVH